MKRFLFCLLPAALAAPTTLLAQTPGYQRLPSGTEYKLYHRDATGQYQPRTLATPPNPADTTRTGKFLLMHVSYLTGRDSVLQSSRQQTKGQAVPIPLQSGFRKGSPEEAFAVLQPGDSAVFRFRADSLFRGRPVPPELQRGGNALVLQATAVGLVDQMTAMTIGQKLQQEMMAEQQRKAKAHAATQLLTDNAAIEQYVKQNGLTGKVQKTAGGTWYVITKRGTGPLPLAGKPVKVKYRGTVLATGKEFDSSEKHGGEPFEFVLGQGQVIQGWDQGIAALPKGSSAMLLIPSPLAYGERGAGADIPANAPLRFDVEVINDAPAKAPASKSAPARKATTAKKATSVRKAPAKATK